MRHPRPSKAKNAPKHPAWQDTARERPVPLTPDLGSPPASQEKSSCSLLVFASVISGAFHTELSLMPVAVL